MDTKITQAQLSQITKDCFVAQGPLGGYYWFKNKGDKDFFAYNNAKGYFVVGKLEIKVQMTDPCVYALITDEGIFFKWKNDATHVIYKMSKQDVININKYL